jgi:methylenetetrahydrofolate--tRNA-(uracil-5-)-methyltransferase
VFFAGQMSGVEGYVESAASGLMAGLGAVALTRDEPIPTLPRTTAIGALAYYVSHADPTHYDPSNITFGIMEALPSPPRSKLERKLALSDRALTDLAAWMQGRGLRRPDIRGRESTLEAEVFAGGGGAPPAIRKVDPPVGEPR